MIAVDSHVVGKLMYQGSFAERRNSSQDVKSGGNTSNGLVEIVKSGLYLADRLKIFEIVAVPARKIIFHVDDKNVVGWSVSLNVGSNVMKSSNGQRTVLGEPAPFVVTTLSFFTVGISLFVATAPSVPKLQSTAEIFDNHADFEPFVIGALRGVNIVEHIFSAFKLCRLFSIEV